MHLSCGDHPARDYLTNITSVWRPARLRHREVHRRRYDAARRSRAGGSGTGIAPEAEKWRQMGVFGAAVDVPEDAPLQDRLLGLTGWQPR